MKAFSGAKAHHLFVSRPVGVGAAGGAMATPDFVRSVNPISIRGGRLCPPNNTGTPGFSDLPAALHTRFKSLEVKHNLILPVVPRIALNSKLEKTLTKPKLYCPLVPRSSTST